MIDLHNPSGCLHVGRRRKTRSSTQRRIAMTLAYTTLAAVLAATAFSASAQHAATITVVGTDIAQVTFHNDGPTALVAAEFFLGVPAKGRAIFSNFGSPTGTADFAFGDVVHYSVTTFDLGTLQQGAATTETVNFDQYTAALEGSPFSTSATGLFAYTASRVTLTWADGFEATVPTSRPPIDAVFTFTDIPPVPPVSEPGTTALTLAGLGTLAVALCKKGGAA